MMENVTFFKEKARKVRRELFEKFVLLQQGHPGSTFSMADFIVALYYGNFVRRKQSDNITMYDKLIVSKGHATVCLYPVLADIGVIPAAEWENWGRSSSSLRLFGNIQIPGIDATSGSLGHGLGVAAGYALSFKRRNTDRRVFAIVSEGELYEGSIWESLLFINQYQLDNLYIIVDRNDLIILGNTESCLRLEPVKQKLQSFGIRMFECDGHNFSEILNALDLMTSGKGPACLIAKTVKGKGVRFMENKPQWHYWNPLSAAEIETCRNELR